MQIDDTASPAPATVAFASMQPGSIARRANGHYIAKAADGSGYDATADLSISLPADESLVPVPGKLVIG